MDTPNLYAILRDLEEWGNVDVLTLLHSGTQDE
jgi:hypothetical protein